MEWYSNGLLISDKTKGVTNYYSDEATEKNLLNIVKCNNSLFYYLNFNIYNIK